MCVACLVCLERQSAEAMVSNFKFNFRAADPDHRLRVQAIIETTINEAKQKINKKMFAKHLENSKKDLKNITDSKRQRKIHNELVREAFYKKRDVLVLKETNFDLQDEKTYQRKQHHRFIQNMRK